MTRQKKTWDEYVPQSVTLVYIDSEHNLDSCEDLQEKCIRENSMEALIERVATWYYEQESDNLYSMIEEIRRKMVADGNGEEYDRHSEDIQDLLCERDGQDVIYQLIHNSQPVDMFYSLGVEIKGYSPGGCGREESEDRAACKIRRALKLKKGQYREQIEELIGNAPYGGELRIYFNTRFDKLISGYGYKDFKSIRFHGDVVVAIADSPQGSGHHIRLPLDITLPFNRDNLFVDSEVHYSYAREICGLAGDWCRSTRWQTGMQTPRGSIQKSRMTAHQSKEALYETVFRNGSCTFGDMNIRRHRNTCYVNHFPCGTHCKDCGTFWID